MTFFLNSAIQVTVILSLALLLLPLLRKKSAAFRHSVLATAIVFSLLIPIFNLFTPVWKWSAAVGAIVSEHPVVAPIREAISAITSPEAQTRRSRATERSASALAEPSELVQSLPPLLRWVWAGGVAAGLLVLLTGFVRLARVVSASAPMPNGVWRQLVCSIS